MSPRKEHPLGDPAVPISSTVAFKVGAWLLLAALSLGLYIAREHMSSSVSTHERLWQKYGDVQGKQADQAADLKALGVETGYIKGEVEKANTKLDRLLEPRGR